MVSHRPYELKEYDPVWKERFLDASRKLKSIYGDNLLAIEHIGSTSIEGMIAKPQIDILVVVKNLDMVKNYYELFIKAGFMPRGRGYTHKDDEYFTEDSIDGRRLTSVHTLQEGNPRIEEYIIFRDYMRVNKKDRELYILTKHNLYSSYRNSYNDYYHEKRSIIDFIQDKAMKWSKRGEK